MSLGNLHTADFIKGDNVTQTDRVIEIAGGGGHEIQDDTTPLTQRAALNFERMIITDDAGNDATIVTRPADTFVGTTAPSSPVAGDVWTDTNDTVWKTYVRYDGYWVERTGMGVAADSYLLQKKVTVSSAQLLTLGTVPVEIVAAPGANKYLNIQRVSVSYNYNSVVYDFSSVESPIFQVGAGNVSHFLSYLTINGGADFNVNLHEYSGGGFYHSLATTNTALTLTTVAGTNPSQGNGDLDIVVYYSIEDVNT
jgi:hypothetical protein